MDAESGDGYGYRRGRELLAVRLGVDPSAQLEQAYLRILRGEEGVPVVATGAARPSDQTLDAERSVVPAPGTTPPPVASSPLTSFVGRDSEVSKC
jgi:DNA-binding SARP family transcriptional activator